MFAIIQTNGATHIAIHVPHEGAEKTLPAIAAMLENNAVFINQGYSEIKTVEPSMSIILGDKYTADHREADMVVVIPESDEVIGSDFVVAKPDVYISNAVAMKKKDDEIARIRTELNFVKSERDDLTSKLQALINANEE